MLYSIRYTYITYHVYYYEFRKPDMPEQTRSGVNENEQRALVRTSPPNRNL